MLAELGEEYERLQDDHMRLMREAIDQGHGTEIRTEGDAFFVAFSSAVDAVTTAVIAQRAFTVHPWSHGRALAVRMGIHSGEGRLGGDDYLSIDVNLAARIAAAGHGGQVLLSEATRAIVEDRLPGGVRSQPIGSFRLKDFPGPQRLHQLEIAGLPSAFPPLRALDVRRAHLPPETTTFIGRDAELEALAELLVERRLVTLTGPGGTGKTRLALRTAADVAGRFRDGTFFVGVEAIRDGAALPAAIASALSLLEDRDRASDDVVRDWIRDRELLLVLDNLEQIEQAGPVVDHLLSSASDLRILATSRSPLHVAGEQEFPVPPFRAPAADAGASELEASEAVRLFLDRARLVHPQLSAGPEDLAVIADITMQLDGLPLAIELAAARVRLLSLTAIRDRLGRRLDALARGPSTVSTRQQSMREAIAWSYELLDPAAKALFSRLGVFVGGWTIEAAAAVCGGPPVTDIEAGLEALLMQSLIQSSTAGDESRFAMLQTVGEFASDQLQAGGEADEVAKRHAEFFRGLAEEALGSSQGPEGDAWLDRLENDLDNLRAAIGGASASGQPDQALAIAAALRPFWLQRNHGAEGLRWLVTLADEAGVADGPELAGATAAAAAIATWLGDYAAGRRMGELSVGAYRRLGDRWGFAEAIGSLAFATIEIDPAAALSLNQESLETYRELGDIRGEGQALLGRATAQFALGRLSETRESLERSIELLRQSGDQYFALFCGIFLGRIKMLTGDARGGIGEYRSVLESSRAMDLRLGIAVALDYLGEVAIWAGDVARAVRLGAAAERIKEDLGGGVPPRMGGALEPLVVGRSELPEAEFVAEVERGRAMDLDSVIAGALAIEPPTDIPPSPGLAGSGG